MALNIIDQRHLCPEEMSEDDNTPRSRGTGSRTEIVASLASWTASRTTSKPSRDVMGPTGPMSLRSRQPTPIPHVFVGLR